MGPSRVELCPRLYCLIYPANSGLLRKSVRLRSSAKGRAKVALLLQGHPSVSATLRSNSFGHTKASNTSARVPAGSLA
jgi:hypothetical protein